MRRGHAFRLAPVESVASVSARLASVSSLGASVFIDFLTQNVPTEFAVCVRKVGVFVVNSVTTSAGLVPGDKPVNMRSPEYSPTENPFIQGTEVRTKHKTVRTRSTPRDLMDPDTGEIVGSSIIHIIEERDEQQFVKVFADGVRAAFDLTRTGHKVFQIVLEAYQQEKMTGGYADAVTLFWFGDGLDGRSVGIGERTFERGMKELVQKGFLWHKRPNEFWVNPALFFKGDRVAFLREYRIKSQSSAVVKAGGKDG